MGIKSKHDDVLRHLRQILAEGCFVSGDLLPSENQLSQEHGVSRNTIREAITVLASEGLVRRVQGKGTLVESRKAASEVRTALLLMRAAGDVYERQSHRLIAGLEEHGIMPMVVNVDGKEERLEHQRSCLEHAISIGVNGIIVDDPARRLIQDHFGKLPPTVMINGAEFIADLPMPQILADYRQGARLATEHLRKLGHDQILCVIHRNVFLKAGDRIEEAHGLYGEIIRGYVDAQGMEKARYLFVRREFMAADEVRELQSLLRSRHRPTAIFATSDYRAKVVIDLARRLGLRVPEELAVVGYYNTPWATLTDPPITSVSLQHETIADLAIEHLFGHARASLDARLIVPPELIVRDTCGSHAGSIAYRENYNAQ